jgi:membrane-associated protease RseP (regulator of RpoE activity)
MSGEQRRVLLQVLLFIATCITTTLAGAEWTYGRSVFMSDYSWADFLSGFQFSVPFLLILTVHEFGHYTLARYHRVDSTLPYYIPIPPIPFSIGTMGAVIRLKSKVHSMRDNFDIGIAGPLAGFTAAVVVLFYGFTHLPPPEYIFQIHPEYEAYGLSYAEHVYDNQREGTIDISVGKNLLFLFFEQYVADPARIPNPHEIIHYPVLFAGYLSLIFTFLNLLPIGQLDGGHVVYGLFGFQRHRIIATIIFFLLLLYSGLGFIDLSGDSWDIFTWILAGFGFLFLSLRGLGLSARDNVMYALVVLAIELLISFYFPGLTGYPGYLVFVFVIGRFIGIQHPPSEIEEPLDTGRVVLGWLSLIIFVICFSPRPIEMVQIVPTQSP